MTEDRFLAEELAVLRAEVSDLEEVEAEARRAALGWTGVVAVGGMASSAYAALVIEPWLGVGLGLLCGLLGVPLCVTRWYKYFMARDRAAVRRGELSDLKIRVGSARETGGELDA